MSKKKYLRDEDFFVFKKLLTELLEIKTWNKLKYEKRDNLMNFLNKFNYSTIYRNIRFKKFTSDNSYLKWDFEIVTIPISKTGFFFKYRGDKIFIFCIDHIKYGERKIIIIPVKFNL